MVPAPPPSPFGQPPAVARLVLSWLPAWLGSVCLAAVACADAAPLPARPDVIMMVIDDMGWHNLHAPPVHVNSEIKSPNLARQVPNSPSTGTDRTGRQTTCQTGV